VLSIGKLSAGQESYYERQVAQGRDDYYSGRGEASGQWLGGGAGDLSLDGEVDAGSFAALMAGSDPRSGEELRARRGSIAGFDLTFSAPKSLSLLFAVRDESTSRALVEAHEEAVAAAVGYLEGEACWVRRGPGGVERQRGGGLVAAAYRHRMSRAEDPQLHTHVVAANLARGEDGRWSALDGRALYAHAKAAGFLYQAHLRAAVRERLSWVEWGPVRNGMAEIAGVPEGVLREFSTRRLQILERERKLEAAGVAVRHAGRERVAHDTRKRKRLGIDTAPWRDLVRARAAEHGLGVGELAELVARTPRPVPDGHALVQAEAARLAGPTGLTEKRNSFRTRDAVIAFAAAHGQGARASQVLAAVGRFCGRHDVLRLSGVGAEGVFTTAELLGCEEEIVGSAGRRVNEGAARIDARVVDRVIAGQRRPLSGEQAAAVRVIAESGRGVETIEALAGTGKTTTAGALADVYRHAAYAVLGVAPTGRAVRELKEQAGIGESRTLAGLLARLDRQGGRFAVGSSMLIFDEAGMASTREVARLLNAAERCGVKVVAIGDPGQLPSVQAGGWLGSLGRRFGARELRQVMRQRDGRERRALAGLQAGDPGPYLRHKQEARLLHVFIEDSSGREAERAALAAWHRHHVELPTGQAALICRDNDRRGRLNRAARALLADDGRLGQALNYGQREFAVGDQVICRRNAPALDVDNGTRGVVTQVDHATGIVGVETHAGGQRTLPARYCAEHLEHAYALTAHAMQGATVQWAAVVGSPRDFTRNWSYTALSRSRDPTELFIAGPLSADAADRAEIAPSEITAGRKPLQTLSQMMRRREDEELALDRQLARNAPPEIVRTGHARDRDRSREGRVIDL
jgi:conjugative relaxase-like TrwC/TraI family protein